MTTYVVLGDVMTDVTCLLQGPLVIGSDSPAPISVGGGGSAANTAAWLAASGEQVVYVGRVGADPLGEAAVALLLACGVDARVTVDVDRPTGTCVVLVSPDGERSMVPDPGANGEWSIGDVPTDVWGPSTHLHVSGYALVNAGAREAALEAVRRARLDGGTVSVDTASSGPLTRIGPSTFLSWIAGADVVLANADEATVLTGRANPEDAALALAATFPLVVVKLGAAGALVASQGSPDVIHRHAPEVKVIDSTGAGDAFAAGFLPSWRTRADLASALDAGNALGARVVARQGARP